MNNNFETLAKEMRKLNKDKGTAHRECDALFNEKPKSLTEIILNFFITLTLAVGAGVLLVAYGAWAHAFVGVKLWSWFVVPTFHVEALKLLPMMGIMTFVRLLTYHVSPVNSEASTKDQTVYYGILLLAPWVSLAMGYIIHCLM